ncbi:MAG TPA: hypothetical protein VL137_08280 [Polyangiaceae bacterium]|nr:hypothetical protein [Polyangiaceae bacterium]
MRISPEFGPLVLLCSCLLGCSCSDKSGNVSAAAGAAGDGTGGTGGTGGEVNGGSGGSAGDTGGTLPISSGGNGGSGGSGGGAGGTSGTSGTGGTGGATTSAPPYCATDAGAATASALPLLVADAYSYLNQIGPTVADRDFQILAGAALDCDEIYSPLDAGDAGDASADAGSSRDDAAISDAAVLDATMNDAAISDAAPGDASAFTNAIRTAAYVVKLGNDAGIEDAGSAACFGFHYVPQALYGGVIFQTNTVETGGASGAGICVASGATKITFWARADRTTEIKFGSTRPGVGTSEFWIVIDPTWTQYAIPVPADYNSASTNPGGAWNLFSIVAVPANNAEPTNHRGVGEAKIYVKEIEWTN